MLWEVTVGREISAPTAQFCCELKLLPKIVIFFKLHMTSTFHTGQCSYRRTAPHYSPG